MTNGYLLFYDRATPGVDEKKAGASRDSSAPVGKRPRAKVPPTIFKRIFTLNKKTWSERNVFDASYFDFLINVAQSFTDEKFVDVSLDAVDLNKPSHAQDQLVRTVTRFFFIHLARAKLKSRAGELGKALVRLYTNNTASSAWLLNAFATNATTFSTVLLQCPDEACRTVVSDILCAALSTVSPQEQDSYTQTLEFASEPVTAPDLGQAERMCPTGYCVGVMRMFKKYIAGASGQYLARFADEWEGFWAVLAHFAELGPAEATFAASGETIGYVVDLYLGSFSPRQDLPSFDRPQMSAHVDFDDLIKFVNVAVVVAPPTSDFTQWILKHPHFIRAWIMETTTKQRVVHMRPFLVKLCAGDQKITSSVFSEIKSGMVSHNYEEMRPYFRVLDILMRIEDELQEVRQALTLKLLVDMWHSNNKTWKESDMLIEFILRFAKAHVSIRTGLTGNQVVQDMATWLAENPDPPSKLARPQRCRKDRAQTPGATKVRHHAQTHFTLTSIYHPHGLSIADKQAALTEVFEGKLDPEDMHDSEGDLHDREWIVGQELDVLDTESNWLLAKCLRIEGNDMFIWYLKYDHKYDEWISMDGPRAAPRGTFHTHPLYKKKPPVVPARRAILGHSHYYPPA
jgi:hypothetical protein